jgi:hypothetical protein
VVLDGEPTIVKLANGWVIINVGGGPTDDKPEVILEPPSDPSRASAFLNLRVADIQTAYREASERPPMSFELDELRLTATEALEALTGPENHRIDR